MADQNSHDQAWSVWVNVYLLVTAVALFATAGSAGISGNEVGPGFFPKIAAGALFMIGVLNLSVALRQRAPVSLLPRSALNIVFVAVLGSLGIVIFQQIGLLAALLFLFLTFLSASERKLTAQNLVISVVATFAFHGFFVGFLGIFDPAGQLVDIRWLTPW